MAILEVQNLTKFYKDHPALTDVTFSVKKGEFVAVIGRSGAGKSTLLRCINRLIPATSGHVAVEGVSVEGLKGQALRQLRTKIGMVFQHSNLVPRLTVLENVLHGRLGYKSAWAGMLGLYSQEEKHHALEILERVGLSDQVWKRADELSGGQRQRVGIARALVQDPRIILCDEPIASLDPGSSRVVMDHLAGICRDYKITLLVNLHQVKVAEKYADRILGFQAGKLVFDGTPKKLSKKLLIELYGDNDDELPEAEERA